MFGDNIYQFVITNNINKEPHVINPGFIDKFSRINFLTSNPPGSNHALVKGEVLASIPS